MNRMVHKRFVVTLAVTAMLSAGTFLEADAKPFVYPAKGQSASQEEQDKYECHQWASRQTGVDPEQLAMQGEQSAGTTSGGGGDADRGQGLVDDGAKGATRGAARGAIMGDVTRDAAMGVALSPMVALLRHRRKIEQQHVVWQRQIASEKAELARYDQAYTTCLRGRGYAVSGE